MRCIFLSLEDQSDPKQRAVWERAREICCMCSLSPRGVHQLWFHTPPIWFYVKCKWPFSKLSACIMIVVRTNWHLVILNVHTGSSCGVCCNYSVIFLTWYQYNIMWTAPGFCCGLFYVLKIKAQRFGRQLAVTADNCGAISTSQRSTKNWLHILEPVSSRCACCYIQTARRRGV